MKLEVFLIKVRKKPNSVFTVTVGMRYPEIELNRCEVYAGKMCRRLLVVKTSFQNGKIYHNT